MTWTPQPIGIIDEHGRVVCRTCAKIEGVTGAVGLSGSGCWEARCRYCGMVMEVPLLEKDFTREEPGTRAHVSEVLVAWAKAAGGGSSSSTAVPLRGAET